MKCREDTRDVALSHNDECRPRPDELTRTVVLGNLWLGCHCFSMSTAHIPCVRPFITTLVFLVRRHLLPLQYRAATLHRLWNGEMSTSFQAE